MSAPRHDTSSPEYARYLAAQPAWKRWLDVQAPYRWNLRRLALGFTLDVGCGTGRNLAHLAGQAVGIDPNAHAVAAARARGLVAFTPAEFRASEFARPARFEALLVAHVLEHLEPRAAHALVAEHLAFVRPGGRLVLITPQERGFAADATHLAFVGFEELEALCAGLELEVERRYSFPFPRFAGRFFAHNEFVLVARLPSAP